MARHSWVNFVDTWVFYRSDTTGRWVAHSLNTDHLGMGPSVFEAYVALAKVLTTLLAEHRANPKIRIISPAPKDISDLAKHARRLPKEIVEVAEMKLRGERLRRTPRPPYKGRARRLSATVSLAELAVV
jgi:hypothetical protein